MNLEKLFWSKTKVDILKYLIFRRQWVSMRALETDLWWTFPAIKKQVDVLEEAQLISILKESTGRSISLRSEFWSLLKELFFLALKQQLIDKFQEQGERILQYFWGDKFGKPIGMDIILIYDEEKKWNIDALKTAIGEIFREYRIESVSVVFMGADEREKRYRLADRFVLQVMRHYNTH